MMKKFEKISHRKQYKKTLLVGLIFCMGLFLINFTSAIIWDNVAYYKLDETSGTTAFDSTGNNSGQNNGATTGAIGKINNSYSFDGGDWVNLGDPSWIDSTNEITFSFWLNLTSVSSRGSIIGKADDWASNVVFIIQNINANRFDWQYFDSEGTTVLLKIKPSDWITAGTFYHIVSVLNNTHSSIYINGVLANTTARINSNNFRANAVNLSLGRYGEYNVSYFLNGDLDEVGIWSRGLTPTEISNLYNSGNGLSYDEIYSEIDNQQITLISPENNSIQSNSQINFTANFNITGTTYNYTWKNTTLNVWYNNGTLFGSNFINLSGNNTQNTRTMFDLTSGNYKWNFIGWYGNATYSNNTTASKNYTFQWRPFEIVSQDYNEYVYETDSQRFNLSITTIEDILSVTSKLVYNGTSYNGVTSCSAGTCNIYSLIDIPLITSGESVNRSFYWTIIIYDGSNSYSFNTTEETMSQNITRIHLEKCSATYTTKTLNFSSYREDNLTRLSSFKFQGTFDTWLGSGSIKRNQSFNNLFLSELNLCIKPVIKTQYTNAQIEYSYENVNTTFVARNYYFQNASLTNVTQHIKLYLLEAEDSTTFIIKVQDQKLSGVEDALVYIQKYYPQDGNFRTVQISKTDSNGETVGFYQAETVDYRHLIIKNGVILLQTTQQKVVGKSVPFTLTFTTGTTLDYPWSVFEKNPNIQSSIYYNKTSKMVSFTYIDTTGSTTLGRLIVLELSNSNSTKYTICNTSSTQSSATLTCNMSAYNEGTFIAYGYIESNVSDILNFIITLARDIFGREGLLLGFFIIMVAGFAFIWNPVAGIVAMNVSVILVNLIGFITVSPVFIFAMIAISFIAILLLKT